MGLSRVGESRCRNKTRGTTGQAAEQELWGIPCVQWPHLSSTSTGADAEDRARSSCHCSENAGVVSPQSGASTPQRRRLQGNGSLY